jgi:hypothetical protein
MNRKAYMSVLLALVFLAFAFLTGCSSGTSAPSGTTYVFYLTGQELINDGVNLYTVAGAVTVDSAGNVQGGEEDYNDGSGLTDAPTPIAAAPGALTVDSTTGQGTLTLTVGDTNLGVGGVETFAIQFVNANHALITQFDGSATSSGSLDLQTGTSASGNFAFAYSGVDNDYDPLAIGGVVTVASGGITGVFDSNDDGDVTTGVTLTPGTVSTTDAFGRGTITGTNLAAQLAYYVVGPEAVRLITDDPTAAVVGSAFGQGTATFTNASLGATVFAAAGAPFGVIAAMAGQFTTTNTGTDPASFSGVGEDNELENGVFTGLAATFAGTYSLQSSGVNGYGALSVTSDFGDVETLGVYITDPALNLSDPNNTSGGGGALVIDLSEEDSLPGVAGVLIPQSDTATADFNGNYAVGFQLFNDYSECFECEVDTIAQGSVTAASSNALSFTGDVSDPFLTLGAGGNGLYTGATLTGTPQADLVNVGRYSLLEENENPLTATIGDGGGFFETTIYQASAGQLFWLNVVGADEEGANGVFLGPLEQQGSLTGIPPVQKAMAKPAQQKR